jgi:hypothetical protein
MEGNRTSQAGKAMSIPVDQLDWDVPGELEEFRFGRKPVGQLRRDSDRTRQQG